MPQGLSVSRDPLAPLAERSRDASAIAGDYGIAAGLAAAFMSGSGVFRWQIRQFRRCQPLRRGSRAYFGELKLAGADDFCSAGAPLAALPGGRCEWLLAQATWRCKCR